MKVSYLVYDPVPELTELARRMETAAALGYRRNGLARAVVTGRNPVFGFLVPAPEVEVAARLLAGALEEAEARQHTVQVIRLTLDTARSTIERCVEMRPVGVMSVYVGGATLEHLHQEMARYHIHVAVLDSSFPQERGLRFISDDLLGCHHVRPLQPALCFGKRVAARDPGQRERADGNEEQKSDGGDRVEPRSAN